MWLFSSCTLLQDHQIDEQSHWPSLEGQNQLEWIVVEHLTIPIARRPDTGSIAHAATFNRYWNDLSISTCQACFSLKSVDRSVTGSSLCFEDMSRWKVIMFVTRANASDYDRIRINK
jgi:hypothetical protein